MRERIESHRRVAPPPASDAKFALSGVDAAARQQTVDLPARQRATRGTSKAKEAELSRTKNRLNYKAVARLATLGAMVSALVVAVSASAAGHAATTQVTTVDPTGAVFTCPGTNYTVLGGTVRLVSHDSTAADGSEHLRITRVPTDVTLSDGTTSTIYRLTGANSAGGNISIVTGRFEFTDVTFFNILAPNGGVVARVAGVVHVTSGGGGFEFKFGECEAPQD